MTKTHARVVGAVAALAAGACLVAAPAPADAASPLKHTTYKGDGGQPGTDVTIKVTLKVGNSSSRFTKAIVDVRCPDASNQVVFKNIAIAGSGSFTKVITFPGSAAPRFQLDGTVRTRHRIELEFSTADSSEPCGNYVMEGSAHD